MTNLTDRPNTALLVIDVQKGVMSGAHNRDAVIANITTWVDTVRAEQVPCREGSSTTTSWHTTSDADHGGATDPLNGIEATVLSDDVQAIGGGHGRDPQIVDLCALPFLG